MLFYFPQTASLILFLYILVNFEDLLPHGCHFGLPTDRNSSQVGPFFDMIAQTAFILIFFHSPHFLFLQSVQHLLERDT